MALFSIFWLINGINGQYLVEQKDNNLEEVIQNRNVSTKKAYCNFIVRIVVKIL